MKRVTGFLKERLRLWNSSDTHEQGQTLIIVIFGVFALLILVGLAVDLGLYYVERVRITRAVDAAALAAAYELPLEGAARFQALDYLRQNGYDVDAPNSALVSDGATISPPASGITRTTIWLNTAAYQETDLAGAPIPNSAYRLEVQVQQAVPVIFLRFAGFQNISCQASAVAENVNNLDVAIVFDKSGSMEFDTLCYGCWGSSGDDYPDGNLYPLVWDGAANGTPDHCGPTQRYQNNGEDYYFIEAEEYSYASNAYDRDLYTIGYT